MNPEQQWKKSQTTAFFFEVISRVWHWLGDIYVHLEAWDEKQILANSYDLKKV